MGLKRTKLKSKKNDGVDFEATALVPEILTQDLKQDGALLALAERTTLGLLSLQRTTLTEEKRVDHK